MPAVKGHYKDGIVTLHDPPPDLPEQEVEITFLSEGEDVDDVLAYLNAPVIDKEGYLELLKRYDDPVYWERPGGWDNAQYEAAEAKFLAFAQHLQKALSGKCVIESGTLIQDASFLGSIAPPRECFTIEAYGQVRVSNFGNLVTFYADDIVLRRDCLDTIKIAALKHGYQYVPSDILSEPYTGSNPGVTGIRNWGIRYFDWV